MATLRDVARSAGVSVTTVSNVVNGRFELMATDTRGRVEFAIRELRYRPHARGRSLRRAEALNVGFVVLDDDSAFLTDPFITEVAAGLSNHLAERGYNLILRGVRPSALREGMFFSTVDVDAVCLMMSGPKATRARLVESLRGLGRPLILIQEHGHQGSGDVLTLRQDDFAGGRMLAERLLAGGARTIVLVRPGMEWPAVVAREAGIRHALKRSGARLRVVKCGHSRLMADTKEALAKDIAEAGVPHAVMAINDTIAVAAMQLMAERGLRVPQDVRITGFNGFDFVSLVTPALTTVRSPAYQLGVRSSEAILDRLKAGAFTAPEIVLPVALRPGETG